MYLNNHALSFQKWEGGTCTNDCNPTGYAVTTYHDTLHDCCIKEYTWVGAYDVCMGITSEPTQSPSFSPVDTNTFYMDWSAGTQGKCGELAVLHTAFFGGVLVH